MPEADAVPADPVPLTDGSVERYLQRARLRWVALLPLLLATAGVAFYALGLGPDRLSWAIISGVVGRHLHGNVGAGDAEVIVWQLRAPRVMMGLLVGAALAGSGTVYQALFRNSMADPYLIGVSAGAALGAVIQATLLQPWMGGHASARDAHFAAALWLAVATSRPLIAFIMAVLTALAVYRVALRSGRVQPSTLLLAGVAISLLLSSVMTLLLVRSAGTEEFTGVFFWLMGGLSDRTWGEVERVAPWIGAGLLICWSYARRLNVLLMGDETASQLGVSPETTRRVLLAAATLMTAAAVSTSGIIGFVGLVIPHAMRLIWGPDHRTFFPAAVLAGAAFLVLSDGLARILLAPQEIPVGVVTALAGAPFFLLLLRKNSRM